MKYKNSSKRLYTHLTLHCAFITHGGRQGFYATYFGSNRQRTIKFLSQFDRNHERGLRSVEYGEDWWVGGEYADINNAMCDVATIYTPQYYTNLEATAMLADLARACELMKKWDIEYTFEIPERFRSAPEMKQAVMFE